MDKSTAQRMVRDTFRAAFDKQHYRDFVKELCNGFDETKAQSMLVPDAFKPHVKSCQRLGTYESGEGELVDVLVVRVTESYKLERSRTALRDFVAHKLKRGDSYKDAGLVAFVAPDTESWRFSFVRMEYETTRDPRTGKIKPEERLTPARRFSYVVGADEQCHTAQSRFVPLLQNVATKPALADIEEAFSVEAVTKEFFEQYIALFASTADALAAIVETDATLRADFEAKSVSTVDFTKKLLGQIVFLYFIQKKGWLGVPGGGEWGDGPRNYMRRLVDQAFDGERWFFNDVLEPLFYDTLATDRGDRAWCERLQCRIPFLNGGLFEPLAGYDWEATTISLPNALFSNQDQTSAGDTGSGILDVFDRYNFTVNEAEPLESDVAIDPEMLGKVFENLIEENRRKGLGAFYTPREIVHYMCQESLINYLDNGLNHSVGARDEHSLSVPRQDLEEWIRQSDQFAHYAAARAAGTKGDHYPNPPDSIHRCSIEIDTLLRDITVCDPAIGSGAFPVGMMTEIVRARVSLTPYFDEDAERTPYHFKRHAIQSSLYGVDIDAGAVEIAKLRLWLSLVVDEVDVQQIRPLPNLDYKVVVGNSLLGVEKNLFNGEQFDRLEGLKPQFFDESSRTKKTEYKRQIEELIHELTNGRETFDFEIYFSEVFGANGGFDVVIANPPYVSVEAFARTDFQTLWKRRYKTYAARGDVYCLFYEQGLKLLHGGGVLAYISSNKFQRAAYGKGLRQLLAAKRICNLIDFCELPVFAAATDPMIVIVAKAAADANRTFPVLVVKDQAEFRTLPQCVAARASRYKPEQLKAAGWSLEGSAGLALVDKLRAKGTPLASFAKGHLRLGIRTGLNDAFVIDRATRDRLIREDPRSADLIKPWIRGRDLKRWTHEFHDLYVIIIRFGFHSELRNYPAIRRHLVQFEELLKARGQCRTSRSGAVEGQHHWLELDNNPSAAYIAAFETPKIVIADIGKRLKASCVRPGYFIGNTGYIIADAEPFTLAVLLGTVTDWYARMTFQGLGDPWRGGRMRFINRSLVTIPVPVASADDKSKLTKLAERAAEAAEQATMPPSRGLSGTLTKSSIASST